LGEGQPHILGRFATQVDHGPDRHGLSPGKFEFFAEEQPQSFEQGGVQEILNGPAIGASPLFYLFGRQGRRMDIRDNGFRTRLSRGDPIAR